MQFIFSVFIFYAPNYLGHPDNYIKANPLVTPAHIVPEWYFLPFYAILRAVPDILFVDAKLAGVIAMFASILLLFALPWLDSSPVRSSRFRPWYKQFFWLLVIDVIVLGVAGAKPPEGLWLILGRLATAYYFIHFLILLPLLSRIEPTKPLPRSIGDPVLDNSTPRNLETGS